jgi:hypothetical protein
MWYHRPVYNASITEMRVGAARVQGQPGLHSEIPPQKKPKNNYGCTFFLNKAILSSFPLIVYFYLVNGFSLKKR